MTKLAKYITTVLVCGAILTTVATSNTNQTVVHADSIGTLAQKEITSLRQNVAKSDMFLSYLDYEYGDHAKISEDLKSTIEVVDQDGEVVDQSLLDWSFKFFRMGWNASELSHTHQYDWSMQNRIYNGNKTGDYGILVPTITLKSNPEVTNTRNQSLNSDWRPQISMGNRLPVINIEESERIIRFQEGDPDFDYDELKGVTFTDYEDDIRDLEMAVDYRTPIENVKWSELRSGTHRININVTDSDGATTTAEKIVNIRRTNPPEITQIGDYNIQATQGTIDYSQFFTVTDELDPNPVIEIDDSNLRLTRRGQTGFVVTATNKYGKSENLYIALNVVRDTTTLEAEDFTINNSNFEVGKGILDYVRERVSAFDEFEGDISDLIGIYFVEEDFQEPFDVNGKLYNGEYAVRVYVWLDGTSEPKEKFITVTVDLSDDSEVPVIPEEPEQPTEPEIPDTEEPTVPDNDSEGEEPVVPTPEPEEPDTDDNDNDSESEEPVVPEPDNDIDTDTEEPVEEEPDTDTEVPVEEEPDTDSDTDGEEPDNDTDNNDNDTETPADTDNDSNDSDNDTTTEEPVEEVEDTEKGEEELLVTNSNNRVTTAVLTALGISTTTLAYLFSPFKKKEEKE